MDAPLLSKDNIDENVFFVDSIVTALLSDRNTDPQLFELVTTCQVHSHYKSCCKYKNDTSRCNFGKFFNKGTFIAVPLPIDMLENERNIIPKKI